jgi:hypothetical protein
MISGNHCSQCGCQLPDPIGYAVNVSLCENCRDGHVFDHPAVRLPWFDSRYYLAGVLLCLLAFAAGITSGGPVRSVSDTTELAGPDSGGESKPLPLELSPSEKDRSGPKDVPLENSLISRRESADLSNMPRVAENQYVATSRFPEGLVSPQINWGEDDPDWSIPLGKNVSVAFSPAPSRFAVVGDDLIDLRTGNRHCSVPVSSESMRLVMSPRGTSLAMYASDRSPSVPYVFVYPVDNAVQTPLQIPNLDSRERLARVEYLGEDYLIGCIGQSSEGKFVIWDTRTGEEVSSFKVDGGVLNSGVSPDGKLFVIVTDEQFSVVNLEEGREVDRMQTTWRGRELTLWRRCCGIAFSPDSSEIAASFDDGRLFALWTVKGELLEFGVLPIHRRVPNNSNSALQWLPSGEGWLIGGSHLLLRENLLLVWQLGANDSGYGLERSASIVAQSHVVSTRSSANGNAVVMVEIPWDRIREAMISLEATSKPFVAPGDPISIETRITALNADDQKNATEQLLAAVQHRLSSTGIAVAENQISQLILHYSESTGDDLKLQNLNGDIKNVPTTKIAAKLEWVCDGQSVWNFEIRPYGPFNYYGKDVSPQSLRDEVFNQVLEQIESMIFPTRIGRDSDMRLPLQTGLRDRRGDVSSWQQPSIPRGEIPFPILPFSRNVGSLR